MQHEREFDVIVYGATGFVGKRASRYLAERAASISLRWAIAGRDRTKLETLAKALGGGVPVIIAEAADREALAALAARTCVVLAMAGPFAQYADALVEACVAAQTHYADITGESPWVRTLIDRFHDRIGSNGTRIVPGCGFDSVPSDIGAFVTARFAQRDLGDECYDIKAFFRMNGGLNGGTLASLMSNAGDPQARARIRDTELLTPQARKLNDPHVTRDPSAAIYDLDADAWLAPFVMGPINTRVVRRSAGLFAEWNEGYAERFTYQEYMKFPGPFGAIAANALAAGSLVAEAGIGSSLVRDAIKPFLPKPGEGPSEAAIENGYFTCELVGATRRNGKIRATLEDRGDPGNAVTVKCACESALALARDTNDLPGGPQRGGVLTPATALGDVLVRRLLEAGMTIDVDLA